MKEEGADIVIALSHSGMGPMQYEENLENASVLLAGVDGIDAIVTGHSHLDFPGPKFQEADGKDMPGLDNAKGTVGGKPGVMGGFWGSHLGLIDLMLERDGNQWKVVGSTAEARPISKRVDGKTQALVESKADVENAAKAEHEATLAYVRTPVGKTSAPLYSYFALVADDPSVQIVSPGADLVHQGHAEGHRAQGPAGAFGGRALQGRRPRRGGLLHRRAGRRRGDQERRRPLPLPEHRAGGGDHRRAGKGMAGDVGRHLQHGREGQGRPAADQSSNSRLTIST